MHFLEVSGISKQSERGYAVHDISFFQQKGRKLAVSGETGSGKSTLLRIIGGLAQPLAGEVRFESVRVKGPEERLIPGHPGIAYLSQHFEMPNHYRISEILDFENRLSPEKAGTLYRVCRIEHLLGRWTTDLSGGEKQRIALARLLITAPRLLLLDEPFSNLDPIHKETLKGVIREIGDTLQTTCILVAHDPLDTLAWADEILVLHRGVLVQQGSPKELYRRPVNEYVAGLFGNYTLLEGEELQVFPGPFPLSAWGKKAMIRPEQFLLHPTEEDAAGGTVTEVRFFGSHEEADVSVSGVRITIRTALGAVQKGDWVFIRLYPESVWFL